MTPPAQCKKCKVCPLHLPPVETTPVEVAPVAVDNTYGFHPDLFESVKRLSPSEKAKLIARLEKLQLDRLNNKDACRPTVEQFVEAHDRKTEKAKEKAKEKKAASSKLQAIETKPVV